MSDFNSFYKISKLYKFSTIGMYFYNEKRHFKIYMDVYLISPLQAQDVTKKLPNF